MNQRAVLSEVAPGSPRRRFTSTVRYMGSKTASDHQCGERQGTVSRFDSATHSGSAVRDDGTEIDFTASAFAPSGLRFLRPGQRVRWECGAAGDITAITVVTL